MSRAGALLFLALMSLPASAGGESITVRVYATALPGGRDGHGTGFWLGDGGHIVTAYHVVMGAASLEIMHGERRYKEVFLAAAAPDRDLALLRVNGRGRGGLSLDPRAPPPSEELSVEANSRGIPRQIWATRTTQGALLDSLAFSDRRGLAIFAASIEVLPLDLTIYGGMSGAPVMSSSGIVGVLSGSLHEGGSHAWAIPAKYVEELLAAARGVPERRAGPPWADFRLMKSSSWRSARRDVVRSEEGLAVLAALAERAAHLKAANDRLRLEANVAGRLAIDMLSSEVSSALAISQTSIGRRDIGLENGRLVDREREPVESLNHALNSGFGLDPVPTARAAAAGLLTLANRSEALCRESRSLLQTALTPDTLADMPEEQRDDFERRAGRIRLSSAAVHDACLFDALGLDFAAFKAGLERVAALRRLSFASIDEADRFLDLCAGLSDTFRQLNSYAALDLIMAEKTMLERYHKLFVDHYEYVVYRRAPSS